MKLNPGLLWPPTTFGLETEWDDTDRKGRDGQKKKIGIANEKRKSKNSKKNKR